MAIKLPIYMDYHATTPVDPRVLEAMIPYFTQAFGNAASRNHPFGWEAEEAVEKARKQGADLIGANAKEKGILFHTDAVQIVGKVPFNVNELGVHMASLSAHKMYGPKGVGALYVRRRNPRVLLSPIIDGGGHERGMRSGTLNVTGIVGFGKAAELCRLEMAEESKRLRELRDYLNDKLHKQLDEIYINGSVEHRLPHNLNIRLAYRSDE